MDSESTAFEIHRIKGRLVFDSGRVMMLQGVREIFEIFDAAERSDEKHVPDSNHAKGKIVIIGRGIHAIAFQDSINRALT